MGDIAANTALIKKNIADAMARAGQGGEVRLIGVTKTVQPDRIRELIGQGVTELGENRVQELLPKCEELAGVTWHLIGQLQTNKVKYIIGKCVLIHSVDSLNLAREISKRSEAAGLVQDILIEVNIGDEASKGGIKPEDAVAFTEGIKRLSGIRPVGLMCVAPDVPDMEQNRPCFKRMAALLEQIRREVPDTQAMTELSMGMTNDYPVAVEEGATMVRVGSGIFGKRNYKIDI